MRLLVVTPRLLYPATTGAKIRSSQLFERLAKLHDVTMVAFRTPDEGDDRLALMRARFPRLETCHWEDHAKGSLPFYVDVAANVCSRQAFTIAKYVSAEMRRTLTEMVRRESYDLLVCDFVHLSPNVLPVPLVPKVLFQHNVESVIRRRQYETASTPLLQSYLWWDWMRLERYERDAARAFDHSIMVSEADCETMTHLYGVTNVSAIPTGVDVEFFRPGDAESPGHHIVFTGSMDWFPNVDGIRYFAAEILPLIRRELDVTFWIVGRSPGAGIRQLGDVRSDIRVTGTVDDVRPYIARGGVYVVPLRIGGGTRIKIFEAMAMGKAVVSTTVGAEGLPVTSGGDIILADDPQTFASAVIRLLRDPAERHRLARAARQLVAENHTWDVAAHRFGEICASVHSRLTGTISRTSVENTRGARAEVIASARSSARSAGP